MVLYMLQTITQTNYVLTKELCADGMPTSSVTPVIIWSVSGPSAHPTKGHQGQYRHHLTLKFGHCLANKSKVEF